MRLPYRELRHVAEAWLRRILKGERLSIEGKMRSFHGLNHRNYLLALSDREETLFLRLPKDHPTDEHRVLFDREAATLRGLSGTVAGFTVPEVVAYESEAPEFHGSPALLTTVCSGIELESLPKRPEFSQQKCELLGQALAAVHQRKLEGLEHLPRHANRNQHLMAEMAECGELPPEVSRYLDQVLSQDSPSETTLLHGDILPQNLIWPPPWKEDSAPGIVDWEFAQIGDPAYDFSILFRGRRRLFKLGRSRQLVLESYHRAGGPDFPKARITAYELLLLVRWSREPGGDRQGHLARLAKLCRTGPGNQ